MRKISTEVETLLGARIKKVEEAHDSVTIEVVIALARPVNLMGQRIGPVPLGPGLEIIMIDISGKGYGSATVMASEARVVMKPDTLLDFLRRLLAAEKVRPKVRWVSTLPEVPSVNAKETVEYAASRVLVAMEDDRHGYDVSELKNVREAAAYLRKWRRLLDVKSERYDFVVLEEFHNRLMLWQAIEAIGRADLGGYTDDVVHDIRVAEAYLREVGKRLMRNAA